MRAPALVGRRWLNVPPEGAPTVAGLRGRVAVLHFSTSGCVNCTHAEAELDVLAGRHPALVVVGVHSPKFPHEATAAALDTALDRAGTTHPVLDDAERATWDAYAVRAWPTLVVLDPDGRIAGTFEGEGHLAGLHALVDALLCDAAPAGSAPPAWSPVPDPSGAGTGAGAGGDGHDPGAGPRAVRAGGPPTGLRHPSAALALPDGRLLVSDAGHRRLVAVGVPVVDGCAAGPGGAVEVGARAGWVSPAGAALVPPGVAARVGWDVAVADPGAHLVRGVRLADGAVTTLAGTGEPLRPDAPAVQRGGPALRAALSSPTGVAWCAGRLVVAVAGVHQLWTLDVAPDPADGVLRVVAGSGVEGLLDGVGADAMLAQPSALAAADGTGGADGGPGAWFVDAESSSLRRARPGPGGADGPWEVTTLVGTGTYAFGHVDGDAADALMQHPLGVAVAADGAVLVADTYDGAVRRVDPVRALVTTLVDGLAEPAAVVVVPGGLVVVESAAHRLTPVAVTEEHVVAPGEGEVVVDATLPAGQRPDDAGGPAARLEVSASSPGLLDAPAGASALRVTARLGSGAGTLVVRARLATCDDGADGTQGAPSPGAACHLHERTWRVPVVVRTGAARRTTLPWAP